MSPPLCITHIVKPARTDCPAREPPTVELHTRRRLFVSTRDKRATPSVAYIRMCGMRYLAKPAFALNCSFLFPRQPWRARISLNCSLQHRGQHRIPQSLWGWVTVQTSVH